MSTGIELISLTKKFPDLTAVDNINLKIRKGHLFGFLGPNGAGKSTTINMLSTVLKPTSGTANILGYDLIHDSQKIKSLIGVCPQEIVMYDYLTARENIELIARLHKIPKSEYKEHIDELLGKMKLLDRANSLVKGFSGGMKRRINVLMAVIHNPEIIFFDEPTAGLDPQSRRVVWDFIKDFEKDNKTIILTTHNMEEADDLSDNIAIIDHGKIIAEGSPQQLKGEHGKGDIIEFRVFNHSLEEREKIVSFLNGNSDILWAKSLGKERIVFNAYDGLRNISHFYELLDQQFKIKMQDLVIRQNTLEDVFIDLTGRNLRD
ncbi:MAG: ATP-binding cassette domain-containing protein [Candidatus Lokiarchaeota archaeon]|nr:ATP-binding cassette domain-containing protein [Candidatus Harpocratesius repetitus]